MVKGALYSPIEAVGGLRDALQEFTETVDMIAKPVGMMIGNELRGLAGKKKLTYEDFAAAAEKNTINLPEIMSSNTVTGNIVRKGVQFLVGYAAGGAIMGNLGAGMPIAQAAAKGAVADLAFFDKAEGNLLDVAREAGFLPQALEFLASDPNDSDAEGKLKNALTGVFVGVGIDVIGGAIGKAFKTFRAARAAKKALNTDLHETITKNVIKLINSDTDEAMITSIDDLTNKVYGKVSDAATAGAQYNIDVPEGLKSKLADVAKRAETGVPDDILAKSLTKDVLTSPGTGRLVLDDMVINLDRITGPHELKAAIAEHVKAGFGQAQRGVRVRTWSTVEEAAMKLNPFDVIERQRIGQPLSDIEVLTLRKWRAAFMGKTQELGNEIIANAAKGVEDPALAIRFHKARTLFLTLHEGVQGAAAEAGRALNIFRKLVGDVIKDNGAGEAVDSAKNAKIMASVLDNLGGNESALDAARLLQASFSLEGEEGVDRMLKASSDVFSRPSVYARTRDGLIEAFYNNILSGPKTHIRNIIGNTSAIVLDLTEKKLAGRLAKIMGDDAAARDLGEVMDSIIGMKNSFMDAASYAGKALLTGEEHFGEGKLIDMFKGPQRALSAENFGMGPNNPIGWLITGWGKLGQASGRALMAEDQFFSAMVYGGELKRRAGALIRQELESGTLQAGGVAARLSDLMTNPTKEMMEGAMKQAKYLTFRTPPGKFMQDLNKLRKDFPALRFVVPFMQVVGNIFKFTGERTPAAVLMPSVRASFKAGGADAYTATARMLTGTFLLGLGMDMTLSGQMTGPGPKGDAERKRLLDMGIKPFSVKIGDKMMYINRTDPGASFLTLGASIAEVMMNAGDEVDFEDIGEMITRAGFAVSQVAMDKSMLSSVSGLVAAIEDPKRYSEKFMQRFIGSLLVPNIVADIGQAIDPNMRYATDFIETIRGRIPRLRESLPLVRDHHGRPISYRSSMGAAYDLMSPLYISDYKPEMIDLAMMDDGQTLPSMPTTVVQGEASVSLRNKPAEMSRFHELIGQTKPSRIAVPTNYVVNPRDIKVIDGDTFEITTPAGPERIRLAETNTAEIGKDKDVAELQRLALSTWRSTSARLPCKRLAWTNTVAWSPTCRSTET